MPSKRADLPWVLPLVLALSACTAGPDHRAPELAAPEEYARHDPAVYTRAEAERAFWQQFGDPLLDELVDDALTANHDLRIAVARYDRNRALLRQARQDRIPGITASATAGDRRASASESPGASRAERDGSFYEADMLAFWELDFFGRVRRAVQAQNAEAEAARADLGAMQVIVTGELVDGYFQLRGLQEQLAVARANAANQRESLALVEARLNAGRGTELDRIRARAQLESTRSRIPALEAEIAAATHRIAVLTGRPPGALVEELEPPAELPALPERVITGLPGELLRRRPDIIAAERRLEAATARIGVATADLYPRFTLNGLLGTRAGSIDALFERDAERRLIALGVDWTFLDTGRVRARMAAADADAEADLAAYQHTVLLAMEETENALARYGRSLRERTHLRDAAADSARAARLARQRYEAGVVDFLQVIDAERTRLAAEDDLVRGRTRSARTLVALYKAMAGGWPEHLPGPVVQDRSVSPVAVRHEAR